MIPDWETNTVYFSKLLAANYADEFAEIEGILKKHNLPMKVLGGTKDIWCRDYMPVQISTDDFLQFRYDPSYLLKQKYRSLKSDPELVCSENGIKAHLSNINLDGGNLIKGYNKVIISDKVFDENPHKDPFKLLSELEDTLNASIIIIPHHYDDYTGHADGMIRFINEDTVIINELSKEYPSYRYQLTKILRENKLNWIEIPMVLTQTAVGIYINYLQVEKLVLMPNFDLKEDETAFGVMEKCFPDCKIETVKAIKIAKQDGVLNCISWNIFE